MGIAVFLVDDHEIVRRGIADVISSEDDLTIVGEAASVGEAVARVPVSGADVAILDVRLPDGNGVELCRELKSLSPDLHCLILTSYSDDEALLDAIMAGASGFLLKQVLGPDLASAIRAVAAGRSLLDDRSASALMTKLRRRGEDVDQIEGLSPQERTVLDFIGEGLTNRQIASRMGLSEKTVKNYVSHLLSKLGVKSRTSAAVLATRTRRVRPTE